MNWNEILQIVKERGFVLMRHGANHDIYVHPETRVRLTIPRHWSKEVKRGLMNELRKKLNF